MRIIRLEAENVKRLRCVEIEPNGAPVVQITGRNAQGKTSVLDSIWMALGGGRAAKHTGRPIRDGERRASVTLDLGELTVSRSWTTKGTRLHVEAADGSHVTSPQKLLDSLVGSLSFDPLAFAGLPARKQRETLLDLVVLPFDVAEVDKCRADLYEERREVNRAIKDLEARLDAMPRPLGVTSTELVSPADLLEELEAARGKHDAAEAARSEARDAEASLFRCSEEVARLRRDLVEAECALSAFRADAEELGDVADALSVDLPDVDAARSRLSDVESTNTVIRQAADYKAASASLKRGNKKADDLTKKLEELDATKAQGLREAKMPISGLGFDADGVTYKGVPFGQASAAERLRVSMAMAMALNPKLRVIRITEGSLLDSENLAIIERMAEANDFQVWLEVVREDGAVGVVIEDGSVVAVDGVAV